MGITRVRAVRKYKQRELEKVLKMPVIVGTLLLGKRKKRGKRK